MRFKHLALVIVALSTVPFKSQADMITGSIPFDGPAPFTNGNFPTDVFGGLTIPNAAHTLDFTITYDETAADTDGSATRGDYRNITQAVLTIGAETVTLNPGSGAGDFSAASSSIVILAPSSGTPAQDRLLIDIQSGDFSLSGQLGIFLIGPAGSVFSNDGIDPIGGATTLAVSDFTTSRSAVLQHFNAGAPNFANGAAYNLDLGTVTFPNSVAIPEPSSFLLLGVVACGGMIYRRKQLLALFRRNEHSGV